MPEFIASLPVVAADGTMRKRLHGEASPGSAHIKTGLLVRCARDGRLRARPQRPAPRGRDDGRTTRTRRRREAALDALLAWVYDRR